MNSSPTLEIFLACPPGLETLLAEEVAEKGFKHPAITPGGITTSGGWSDVWRANLELRGATRVLVRIGSFKAQHLAQLDKRARKFPWGDVLRKDVPVRVDVTCRKSRIYHSGAATQRVETAIREELGATVSADADVRLMVRIDNNKCTVSVDTSGEPLHKRGHKEAVGKAPLRENLAALFLRQCGYAGHEPVVDPMCGSGTFVIEAAEIAKGLHPGRSRLFAFESLAGFDPQAWADLKSAELGSASNVRAFGCDRDEGAIGMSTANAERAGVGDLTEFSCHAISDLVRPEGRAGLVVLNPPYGTRIGEKSRLHSLYAALGDTLRGRFSGWRVGLVTTESALANATRLPFLPSGPPVPHGGLKVTLYHTDPLD